MKKEMKAKFNNFNRRPGKFNTRPHWDCKRLLAHGGKSSSRNYFHVDLMRILELEFFGGGAASHTKAFLLDLKNFVQFKFWHDPLSLKSKEGFWLPKKGGFIHQPLLWLLLLFSLVPTFLFSAPALRFGVINWKQLNPKCRWSTTWSILP